MNKKENQDTSNIAYNKLVNLLAGYSPKNVTQYIKIRDQFITELKKYLIFLENFEKCIKSKKNIETDQENLLRKMSERIILLGYELEKEIISIPIKRKIEDLFRECIGNWLYKSHIVNRSFYKPRGYSGDYKIIEMFYEQKTLSKGIGYYFDKYILDNKLAKADIYRKDRMKELLENFLESTNYENVEIVNFGCGGCKDIRDLFQSFVPKKRTNFIAVDQDVQALKYSEKHLKALPEKVNIKYLPKNILELILAYRNKNSELPFVNKHLIYSIGLVDYFGDNTLQLFIRFCLKSLSPGGQLIIAHKNSDKWKSFLAPYWFCDWRFYQRNKKEVLKIIKKEIAGCKLRIRWEKTYHMFFLIITKRA